MSAVDSSNPHQFSYDPDLGVCFRTLDFMGFPGYRVGDDGSVWSRRNRWYLRSRWTSLRLTIGDKKGYPSVKLYGLFGAKRTIRVHQLVLLAFVSDRPRGMEGCHSLDPNPKNNRLENLRWDTAKNNKADEIKHGTRNILRGEAHNMSALTEKQVREIRSKYKPKVVTCSMLGKEYNVSATNIHRIVTYQIWKLT